MSDPRCSWSGMMARCHHKSNHKYKRYGGRGISVCERWHDYENFKKDMGERPEGTSLDRINNDGDYCPENCRWATHKEQNRNRSDNRRIEFNGETKTLPEWADIAGISRTAFKRRLERGWDFKRALSQPLTEQNHGKRNP